MMNDREVTKRKVMTLNIHYYRPETVSDALQLLAESGATVLAGGTRLVPRLAEWPAVIDLQGVGLDQLAVEEQIITIGSMVRLQTLVDRPVLPALVRQMAHWEGPNTLRNAATLGGTVVTADPESELYAALLVFEAQVTVQTLAGAQIVPLREFSLPAGGLVTAVTIRRGGKTAAARVARTPRDKPIVAVVGRIDGEGEQSAAWYAICGVSDRPRLYTATELGQLTPPADFRGSSAYRQRMAAVLYQRVKNQLRGEN